MCRYFGNFSRLFFQNSIFLYFGFSFVIKLYFRKKVLEPLIHSYVVDYVPILLSHPIRFFENSVNVIKGTVNLSHWADVQANGLFAHPRSNVINWLVLWHFPRKNFNSPWFWFIFGIKVANFEAKLLQNWGINFE